MSSLTHYIVISRTQPPCPYCKQAIELLTRMKESFEVRELENEREFFDSMGLRTVPAIFENTLEPTSFLGGYAELKRELLG